MSVGEEMQTNNNALTKSNKTPSSASRVTKQFLPKFATPLMSIPSFFLQRQNGNLGPAVGMRKEGKARNVTKIVSFDKIVSVVLVPTRVEYQEAQLNSLLWYNTKEISLILKNAVIGLSLGSFDLDDE
jgi:hypothetical protein